ncbi:MULTISPECIES: hypothetical protein [unclassified Campylobacter]|uniref:hypothetical protein n=1 Tax=unclassified Campylobacter TaxID=2593542 RepID=UPI001D2DCFD8|nr:hypothetical protein [Campylobacter sp. RM9331]MBZ8005377.1 hypothetical protein [Campylobacter sp. RM9332]
MFKNIFLKTLLNIFLLNYNASLSTADFFKFWGILLLILSSYIFFGFLMFKMGVIKSIFTFQAYFIDILILPFFSILFLSLIYKANSCKSWLFYAGLFLIPLFVLLVFFGVFYIILIFILYVIIMIFNTNSTNLNIKLNKKSLIFRLITICFLIFIAFIFPPDIKFIKYGYGIDYISFLTFLNFAFLIPSFATILIYFLKNYKSLK